MSVTCCYEFSHHGVAAENRLTWLRGQSGWDEQLEEVTEYTYNGSCGCDQQGVEPLPGTDSRLMQVHYYWTDYVNLDQNGDPTMGAVGEYSVYDELLGRRIATYRCSAQGTTSVPYGNCKGETVQYDYYGLSQRVAVVRQSPFKWTGGKNGHWIHSEDQFIASFTYGPLGATIRTDENRDADPVTNSDHYVLADVFGGTVGMLVDQGAGNTRSAAFQHFDAFGIELSTFPVGQSGRYRWRSQEGSETDDLESSPTPTLTEPKLVYMQTRHYNPETGRFLQADTIPMGAFSPQGLNRYTYCANDPVNCSDPGGKLVFTLIGFILGVLAASGAVVEGLANGFTGGAVWLAVISTLGALVAALDLVFAGGAATAFAYSALMTGAIGVVLWLIGLYLAFMLIFALVDMLADQGCYTITDPYGVFAQAIGGRTGKEGAGRRLAAERSLYALC